LISQLSSLWHKGKTESEFTRNIKILIKAKNDVKHDRGPHLTEQYETATREVGKS